ncbi:MAG: SWIM zinc finger domain-containing protein [Cyanobacteria bacterium J06626_18]
MQNLIDENPGLLESVDRYVNRLAQPEPFATKVSSPKRKTSVDPAPFKRRAKEILRSAVRDWEYGRDDDDIAFDMGDLMETALDFLEQGDTPNAMVALQGITEGCLENWDEIDDFCRLTPEDVDLDFDAAWTEVILSAELIEDEALEWQERFEIWQDQLTSLAMSLEALRQGWDYPPLIKVFQGGIAERGAWSGEAPDWAGEFSQIRLKILARKERYEDYLHLAKAEGQIQAYMTMLGQLGRLEQVMAVAQNQMTTLTEAKALAAILRSQDQLPQALQIALQGLRLDNNNPYAAFEFGVWTSDLAEGMGDQAAALEVRIIAFKAQPSFKDYRKPEELAAIDWPTIREELLQYLRTARDWGKEQAQVDIFRHHVVNWLKRVKAAHEVLEKTADWSHYRQKLIDTHGRKRKLIGLMQQSQLITPDWLVFRVAAKCLWAAQLRPSGTLTRQTTLRHLVSVRLQTMALEATYLAHQRLQFPV